MIAAAVLMTSCAHSVFYKDGQRIARFEGDMTDMVLKIDKDGAIEWKGNISHSAATKAQGEASAARLGAAGSAIGAASALTLIK